MGILAAIASHNLWKTGGQAADELCVACATLPNTTSCAPSDYGFLPAGEKVHGGFVDIFS
jgi:hypothetical protein